MAAAWVAFATTGNPNHPLLPKWPAYDTTTRGTMVINNDWSVVNDPYRGREEGRGGRHATCRHEVVSYRF